MDILTKPSSPYDNLDKVLARKMKTLVRIPKTGGIKSKQKFLTEAEMTVVKAAASYVSADDSIGYLVFAGRQIFYVRVTNSLYNCWT